MFLAVLRKAVKTGIRVYATLLGRNRFRRRQDFPETSGLTVYDSQKSLELLNKQIALFLPQCFENVSTY